MPANRDEARHHNGIAQAHLPATSHVLDVTPLPAQMPRGSVIRQTCRTASAAPEQKPHTKSASLCSPVCFLCIERHICQKESYPCNGHPTRNTQSTATCVERTRSSEMRPRHISHRHVTHVTTTWTYLSQRPTFCFTQRGAHMGATWAPAWNFELFFVGDTYY